MQNKLGEILAVRIVSFKDPDLKRSGSGVIYKTSSIDYDLIFTAKHCICRKDSNKCNNNCDNSCSPDFAKTKIKVDNPSNKNFPDDVKIKDVILVEDRDFAVLKTSKIDVDNLRVPIFSDKSIFSDIDGWGFPQINGSEVCTQYHFKEVSKENGQNGKMHIPFDSNTNNNIDCTQSNVSGFSGAGIYSENKYLIGLYIETMASENGKGVIIDDYIKRQLKKKGLQNFHIEDDEKLIRTRINNEFIACFDFINEILVHKTKIKSYCLKLDGRELDTESLLDRMFENVKYYSLSDKENTTFENDKELCKREKKASKRFTSTQSQNYTSDILIFSFLEADLKAPKIISKAEIDNPFSSIHIRFIDNHTYSLIHSTGTTGKDVQAEVENCIEFIKNNNGTKITPKGLISNSVLSTSFDEETYELLKEMLIPSNREIEMSNSYGIFIGFNMYAFGDTRI